MARQLADREYYFTKHNKQEIVGLAHATGIISLTDIFNLAIPFTHLVLTRMANKLLKDKEIVIPPEIRPAGKNVVYEYNLGNSPDEILGFVVSSGVVDEASSVQCRLSKRNLAILDTLANTYKVASKGDMAVFCCGFTKAVLESLPPNAFVRQSHSRPRFFELCRAG